jgi:hypothetical protein
MDGAVVDARELVGELFPGARWAVLAGSVITSSRTAGSDLDIVVVLADGNPRPPYRESREYRGWPVELFVHDGETLARYLAKDLPSRRPVLHRMVATGVLLTGADDEHAQQTRDMAYAVLAAGPSPLTESELVLARYGRTDLLDDLTHAVDDGERTTIAAWTWIRCAEVALALRRHWTGTGKWLLRELRDLDDDLATRWLAAANDPDAIAALARDILARAGGPYFAGLHLPGEPAPAHAPSAAPAPAAAPPGPTQASI